MKALPLLVAVLLGPVSAGCVGFLGDEEAAPAATLDPAADDAPAAPGSLDRAPGSAPAPAPAAPDATTPAAAPPVPPAVDAGTRPFEPKAVVAVIDDGINPYHEAFRDDSPRARRHPATYLPGYPADALPINLTFGAKTLEGSLKADCAEWAKVEPGTLYWFPGTRIVGARVVEGGGGPVTCDDPKPKYSGNVVGTGGHGTMTASRAGGNGYGACPECLLVMLQGFSAEHVTWAAEQPWIDLQSNSWGPVVPVPSPVDAFLLAPSPAFARAVEEAAARQPSFWASGNGALTRLGVAGHPTQLQPHMTPSVLSVGGHDSGQVALWPGWGPHVVSDACESWAAEHDENAKSTPSTGGGTSGATPYVAGIAGRIVLEARRVLGEGDTGIQDGVLARGPAGLVPTGPLADGDLTVDELRALLLRTADPRPDRTDDDGDLCDGPTDAPWWTTPLPWSSVPETDAAILLVGYGAVTKDTLVEALAVLRGEAGLPERPAEDAWFERDQTTRRAFHDAYAGRG